MGNSSVKTNNISKGEIRHFIAEAVQEVLADPDFGLELTAETIKALKESKRQQKEGRTFSFEEIKKKYQDKNK